MRTTIVLARHGRTEWHHGNRYTGSTDLPIDEVGLQQARLLKEWAADYAPDALWSSPMLRARQTIAPIAEALGLEPTVDARLREVDFGSAEGKMLSELPPVVAKAFELDPVKDHFPGGEDPAEAADRVHEVFHQIGKQHEGGKVLVLAHNTLIRLLVCRVLGLPLSEYRRLLPALGPAALVRFRWQDGTVGLEAYNVPAVRMETLA
ncbi:histidine phosphatase family protein [Kribbella capetownensis]|uniref:Histidine phosphatase family protein n=1 Tax=Kribbella capetownensis TaxID=1572659 RepID=A0A4R0K1R0_9ACTN|nr:histidine phosphatase family protein [Kribbella capetownensis]TCC53419.1 histidine phosphatase family protein [Kribbella capetownensis]